MMWTPHDINVMIHHYVSYGPWPRGDTEAYRGTIDRLRGHGLIAGADDNVGLKATDKGRALIEMWCAQPVPVAKYVDPRFKGE